MKPLLNRAQTTIAVALPLYHDFTPRPIVKQHQLEDRSGSHDYTSPKVITQALRFIATIPLIQPREKHQFS